MALANCSNMLDAWNKLPWDYLVWVATRPGVLTPEELLAFANSCLTVGEDYIKQAESVRAKSCLGLARFHYKSAKPNNLLDFCWSMMYVASFICDAYTWVFKSEDSPDVEKIRQCTWLRTNTKPNFEEPKS